MIQQDFRTIDSQRKRSTLQRLSLVWPTPKLEVRVLMATMAARSSADGSFGAAHLECLIRLGRVPDLPPGAQSGGPGEPVQLGRQVAPQVHEDVPGGHTDRHGYGRKPKRTSGENWQCPAGNGNCLPKPTPPTADPTHRARKLDVRPQPRSDRLDASAQPQRPRPPPRSPTADLKCLPPGSPAGD